MSVTDEIRQTLVSMQEESYRAFQAKLIPTLSTDVILGVRLPLLRAMAKEAAKRPDIGEFLDALPHTYLEENHLHSFLICRIRSFSEALERTEAFLPYIDNWAVCDSFYPPVFHRHRQELLPHILRWLQSGNTYPARFAMHLLMDDFADDLFSPELPKLVAEQTGEDYYFRMMQAWYFATLLPQQEQALLPYFSPGLLPEWVRKKALQKALESFRVSPELKAYLRPLR